jgi:fibronectin-binding autotransporter adhesin
MKTIRFASQLTAVAITGFLLAQPVHAAVTTWNNPAGGNWSVGDNWSPSGIPGTDGDVVFGNVGAGFSNTNDVASETIDSLTYDWNNQSQQTTVINPGQTLTVNGSGAAGSALLLVGSATASPASSTLAPAAITGTGGNLVLNGAGDLVVRIGNATAGTHMATLDLSGLDSLTANVGRLLVGQANAGETINRPSGILILAATNNITLTGASPQVMIQDSGSNANGGTTSVLSFGEVNFLNADVMRFAGQKGNANINFNPNLAGFASPPSLVIRNNDGASPVSTIDFGYNATVTSGNSTVAVVDFSAGSVDLYANLVNIAQGNPGPGTGTCTSTVTLGAGPFTVDDLEIGWGNATGANGGVTATLNVNNNFLFSTGAVVTVNTMLRLARTNGGTGVINGTLNLNGGVVIANTIVSGGGVSAINVNYGSTLVVSNTTGTLAFPIGTFFMSSATLNVPALNTGAAVVVKSLTGDESPSVINISKISPVGAYPTTIPIIHYQSESGEYFTLGSLPSGYSGTLVDDGSGAISLNLTAGPVADLAETWSGASSPDWDTSTYNWFFHSVLTNYFDTAVVTFDDTGMETNISLDQPLSPNSITVNNSLLQYTFGGSGNIAGAATLTKNGSASLTLDNQGGDNNISTVIINGGMLQIGAGDTYGGISSVNITNNGALVFDRTDNVTLSSTISGTGTLTQGGGGTLILSGANSYSGATSLTNGTLEIDQTSSGTGPVNTSAGTVLAGGGVVNGPVTVGGQFNPGPSTGPGIFQAQNGLTLSAGSKLNFGLSATDPFDTTANDSVAVSGDLTANNNAINVNFAGTPQNGSSYTLFSYTGTLFGSFNPVITGTHFPVTLDATSSPGSVLLTITGDSGYALDWNSISDNTWDTATTNWLNLGNSTPSTFAAGDSVLFDDTPGVQTIVTIGSGVTVYPSVITNSSDNNYFTINGDGHIGGSASIVKEKSSTLVIATANSFTGTVDIQAGTLQIQNGAALGAASSTIVENGATLDLDGQNIGARPVTVSGSGAGDAGAIINSGSSIVTMAIGVIVMTGDTTFGGTGNWIMNNSGVTASLTGAFNLTKVGANQITFQNLTTVDPGLQNIDIQQGIVEFNGITPSMGDPNFTNMVEAGAELSFAQDNIAWNKNFVFSGDGTTTTVNNGTSATTELDGPVVLHGGVVFNVGGTSLTITNTISGDGGVIKNGGSPLIFTSPSTYTGDTVLNSAALRLNGSADISSSSNIIINAGSTLSVTGRVDSAFTLVSGQTLKGNGVVAGFLNVGPGATVAPGVDAIGNLTVSNAVTLSGTTIMELDEANATNDVLTSKSSITYGGTLNLVNLGGLLSGGSSFKLFNAASYSGSFSINPPTPGPGQTWDTSQLLTSGTIKVAGGGSTGPQFGGTVVSGANVIFSGTGGVASGTYYVLATTNVALPRTSWMTIATNMFDANGNFTFTNSMNPSVPRQFFQLQLP